MTAVSGLMKSGILTDMIVGLQNQVGSGQMDPARLLQSMQGTMTKVLSDTVPSIGDYDEDSEESSVDINTPESGVELEEQPMCEGDSCPLSPISKN